MKPAVERELKISWSIFAASVAIAALFLAWWSDWGKTAEAVTGAHQQYQARQGTRVLQQELTRQQQANHKLHDHIEELKDRIGVNNVPPFQVPADDRRPQNFWQPVRITVTQELEALARKFGIRGYDRELGMETITSLPAAERVEDYLLYLQLATKVAYLAIHTPGRDLRDIDIEMANNFQPVVEAPPDRPALLREYRLRLTVTGPLRDLLWLQHQLVAEEPTPEHREMQAWLIGSGGEEGVLQKVYRAYRPTNPRPPEVDPDATLSPLVLRDIEVLSPNTLEDDGVKPLTMTFHLAGLQFLDPEQRGTTPPTAGGGAAGGHRSARP